MYKQFRAKSKLNTAHSHTVFVEKKATVFFTAEEDLNVIISILLAKRAWMPAVCTILTDIRLFLIRKLLKSSAWVMKQTPAQSFTD
jgi:hypothetical protein